MSCNCILLGSWSLNEFLQFEDWYVFVLGILKLKWWAVIITIFLKFKWWELRWILFLYFWLKRFNLWDVFLLVVTVIKKFIEMMRCNHSRKKKNLPSCVNCWSMPYIMDYMVLKFKYNISMLNNKIMHFCLNEVRLTF